jgi:CoA:oxalate CoA-transferase
MSLPLDGVVVIDLSQIYNGPYATFLLATSGATVIKVEPPGGESLRRRGSVGGAALPFALLNGCKRSIVLNLKTDEGKDLLRDLVRAGGCAGRELRTGSVGPAWRRRGCASGH